MYLTLNNQEIRSILALNFIILYIQYHVFVQCVVCRNRTLFELNFDPIRYMYQRRELQSFFLQKRSSVQHQVQVHDLREEIKMHVYTKQVQVKLYSSSLCYHYLNNQSFNHNSMYQCVQMQESCITNSSNSKNDNKKTTLYTCLIVKALFKETVYFTM